MEGDDVRPIVLRNDDDHSCATSERSLMPDLTTAPVSPQAGRNTPTEKTWKGTEASARPTAKVVTFSGFNGAGEIHQ
jgi:hypothetical protein